MGFEVLFTGVPISILSIQLALALSFYQKGNESEVFDLFAYSFERFTIKLVHQARTRLVFGSYLIYCRQGPLAEYLFSAAVVRCGFYLSLLVRNETWAQAWEAAGTFLRSLQCHITKHAPDRRDSSRFRESHLTTNRQTLGDTHF